jgi:hypothetical protein
MKILKIPVCFHVFFKFTAGRTSDEDGLIFLFYSFEVPTLLNFKL